VVAFIIRRLIQAVPVVFLSSIGVFLLLHLLPGDPAQVLAGSDATPDVLDAVRHSMGLDQPLPIQYLVWVGHVLHGDLGTSLLSHAPISQLIAQRAPATLQLALVGLALSLLVALPTGVLAATQQRRPADWIISSFNGLALAVPNFWLGLLLIILFALVLGWLPPGGQGDFSRDPGLALKFLILPAVTLALPSAVSLSRLTRATMLEVLYEDYVRTARAKGLASVRVVLGHALRNALVPVITVVGLQFGRLLGGAVIIESIFNWPGVGLLILNAIGNRDYAVVQACLLLLVMVFIIVNLLTDLAYGLLDPRIRLAGGRAR
jgi:peptide/nickel transport system permease protein